MEDRDHPAGRSRRQLCNPGSVSTFLENYPNDFTSLFVSPHNLSLGVHVPCSMPRHIQLHSGVGEL